jgi:hypothetical protein
MGKRHAERAAAVVAAFFDRLDPALRARLAGEQREQLERDIAAAIAAAVRAELEVVSDQLNDQAVLIRRRLERDQSV